MDYKNCTYNKNVFNQAIFMTQKRETTQNNTFGQRLAQLRKIAGLTQAELAQAIGTTRRMIAYYETEADDYQTAHLLSKMAGVLDVTTDELLGLKETKINGKKAPRRLLRRIEQIEHLPKRDQQALIRTIDTYLKKAS